MCGSMVDIQSPSAEIRRGKKKKIEERNYRMKILWSALLHRATIKSMVKCKGLVMPDVHTLSCVLHGKNVANIEKCKNH